MLRDEARKHRFRETGGVLLGYQSGDEVVVTEAKGPGPQAKHGHWTFEPDDEYCQAQVSWIYRNTNGLVTYVGDWHTHPHGSVCPSSSDRATLAAIAGNPATRLPQPILWLFRPRDCIACCRWSEAHAVYAYNLEGRGLRPVEFVTFTE